MKTYLKNKYKHINDEISDAFSVFFRFSDFLLFIISTPEQVEYYHSFFLWYLSLI